MSLDVHLVLPGRLDQKTGGYIYDARIVAGLRERGIAVHVHELPGPYPIVDQEAIYEADRVLSRLPDGALAPTYCGIRPKISGPGEPAADFRIDGPETHGIPGLVNLFGIESPGLTSSLAIAEEVATRLDQIPASAAT